MNTAALTGEQTASVLTSAPNLALKLGSKTVGRGLHSVGKVLDRAATGLGDDVINARGVVTKSTNPFNAAAERIWTLPKEQQAPLLQQLSNIMGANPSNPQAKQLSEMLTNVFGVNMPQQTGLTRVTQNVLNNPGVQAQIGQQILPQNGAQMPQEGTQTLGGTQVLGATAGGNPNAISPLVDIQGLIAAQGNGGSGTGGSSAGRRESMVMDLLSAGMKPGDIKTLLDLLMPAEKTDKPLSVNDRKLNANVTSGLTALNDIRGIITKDNMALAGASLPEFMRPGNSRQLSTAIDQLTDVVGRLRSGGAINQAEEERFRRFLPTTFDDGGTIDFKLKRIEELLNDTLGLNFEGGGEQQPSGESSVLAMLGL